MYPNFQKRAPFERSMTDPLLNAWAPGRQAPVKTSSSPSHMPNKSQPFESLADLGGLESNAVG